MSEWVKKITILEMEILELKKINSALELRILRLEQNSPDSKTDSTVQQSLARRFNCWEFKKCGREPGGSKVSELGVCPATQFKTHKGINNRGKNGGRVCWAIVGTLCGGKIQGIFAEKIANCINCDFYKYVELQESQDFRHALHVNK